MASASTPKLWNFSAGPAILPPVVFERAADAVRELAAIEDVVAILGPIFSDEALAAAEAAEDEA